MHHLCSGLDAYMQDIITLDTSRWRQRIPDVQGFMLHRQVHATLESGHNRHSHLLSRGSGHSISGLRGACSTLRPQVGRRRRTFHQVPERYSREPR
jgi:hypothetical protein